MTDPWLNVRTFDYTTYGDGYTEKDFSEPLGASDKWYSHGDYCYVEEVDIALAAERLASSTREQAMREVLQDCADYLDNYSDVVDACDGTPRPNAAMSLIQRIEEVL